MTIWKSCWLGFVLLLDDGWIKIGSFIWSRLVKFHSLQESKNFHEWFYVASVWWLFEVVFEAQVFNLLWKRWNTAFCFMRAREKYGGGVWALIQWYILFLNWGIRILFKGTPNTFGFGTRYGVGLVYYYQVTQTSDVILACDCVSFPILWHKAAWGP